MDKLGVLLIALGNKVYGEQAYNLAMALKYISPDTEICLMHNDTSIEQLPTLSFFDRLVRIPEEYYITNGKHTYFKAKLCMDLLTPFNKTLYLDTDTMFFYRANLSKITDALSGQCMQPYSMFNISMKTGLPLIKKEECKAYNYGWFKNLKGLRDKLKLTADLPNINSSLVLFSTNESGALENEGETKPIVTSELIFDTMRQLYSNPAVRPHILDFRGDLPDEFFFDVAMCKLGYNPRYSRFQPLYADWLHTEKRPADIQTKYEGLLFSGVGKIAYHNVDMYNKQIEFYAKHFKTKRLLLWRPK